MDFIKGKQTMHTKKGATRSIKLLEIIHANVWKFFDVPFFGVEKHFITFIDDYLCYKYGYLLKNKSQHVDVIEIFLIEVEIQLD